MSSLKVAAAVVGVLLLLVMIASNSGSTVGEHQLVSPSDVEEPPEPTHFVVSPRAAVLRHAVTYLNRQDLNKGQTLSFHEWFVAKLRATFGRAIADAVYDPELFNSLAFGRGQQDTWKYRDEFVFTAMRTYPKVPTHFHNISNVLWWAKHLISVGISKLARDSEMEALYLRVAADANAFKLQLFERTVMRAVGAQVQYFHTVLQLSVDVDLSDHMKRALQTLAKRHGLDPLVLLCGWMDAATTVHAVDALFLSTSALSDVIAARAQAVLAAHEGVAPSQALFPLRYDDVTYNKANPLNGKFWNMIRPTAGCSSVVRLCEVADGCRLFCNPEYFLHAGGRSSDSPVAPYYHRFVGMGCNNDYEWENSVVSLFSGASAQSNGTTHRIGWFTAMDCSLTVTPGPRQWNVPESLKQSAVGFGAVSLCADGTKSANMITMPEIKAFQLTAEKTWTHPTTTQPIVRHNAHPDAIAAAKRSPGTDHHRIVAGPSGAASRGLRLFDGVSILKMDIEGFEWNVIPKWLEDELRSVGATAPQLVGPGSVGAIDFEETASDYFSVSLLALEFHRVGHKLLYGAVATGALRAHWLMLHIYALGFILIGNEKNEMDQCCFEHAYVHVRHFVRSEVWMVLRDEM